MPFYVALVDRTIPKLQDYGFPKEITAEDIAASADYFVRNLIHEVPDQAPINPMSEKEKILAHGFDLTQSFRHRK